MALVKVCPNKKCGKIHPASAMFCDSEYCDMRDLTEVIPVPEEQVLCASKAEPEPESEIANEADTTESSACGEICEPKLVFIHLETGQTITAGDGDILGRHSAGSELFSRFPVVSRKHLKACREGGVWCVVDIGSSNGTDVNGISLIKDQSCPVKAKDKIRLAGACTLEVL